MKAGGGQKEFWRTATWFTWSEIIVPVSSGNVRNTEKLSYDKQHQYEILVTAYDCGQKPAAQDTLVQVDVKPVCKPGWQGGPVLVSLVGWRQFGHVSQGGCTCFLITAMYHRGVCKAQAFCCEKWSSLFVLTTPGWYITSIVQLRMSKATHLTHVPSLSRVPFLKSYDIFQSIVIILQCSGESAGKPTCC